MRSRSGNRYVVVAKALITSDNGHLLYLSLGDQHPVERIVMMPGQLPRRHGMADADGERREVAGEDLVLQIVWRR